VGTEFFLFLNTFAQEGLFPAEQQSLLLSVISTNSLLNYSTV